jgi:hypothetical protein
MVLFRAVILPVCSAVGMLMNGAALPPWSTPPDSGTLLK